MKDRPANPGVYLSLLGLVSYPTNDHRVPYCIRSFVNVKISIYPRETYNNSWVFLHVEFDYGLGMPDGIVCW